MEKLIKIKGDRDEKESKIKKLKKGTLIEWITYKNQLDRKGHLVIKRKKRFYFIDWFYPKSFGMRITTGISIIVSKVKKPKRFQKKNIFITWWFKSPQHLRNEFYIVKEIAKRRLTKKKVLKKKPTKRKSLTKKKIVKKKPTKRK